MARMISKNMARRELIKEKSRRSKSRKLRERALKAAQTRRAMKQIMDHGYSRAAAKIILATAQESRMAGDFTLKRVKELILQHEGKKEGWPAVLPTLSPEDERDLEKVQNNEVLYPCFKCVEDERDPEDCNHCEHGVYLGGPCSLCEQKARAARLPRPIAPEIVNIVVPTKYATLEEERFVYRSTERMYHRPSNVYWKVGV